MMKPMLAEASKAIAPTVEEALDVLCKPGGLWLFEPKFDGVRCIATLARGEATLQNRNGVDVSTRYPDVAQALVDTFGGASVVFDGEIIALGTDGTPDFNRLSRRDRQTSVQGVSKMLHSHPVIFVAFDMLSVANSDLGGLAFAERRAILEAWWTAMTPDRRRLWLCPCSTEGHAMWDTVKEAGLEGLIAKRRDSAYKPGRHPWWIKLKVTHRASLLVTGWEEGEGSRAGRIGALIVSAWDGDRLVKVGKVGTGLTDADLAHYLPLARGGYPFVIEVEYASFTKDGRLRFPSHKGMRSDVDPRSCTIEQLKGT